MRANIDITTLTAHIGWDFEGDRVNEVVIVKFGAEEIVRLPTSRAVDYGYGGSSEEAERAVVEETVVPLLRHMFERAVVETRT